MEFTASQIAELLSGKVDGNPDAKVWNIAKIEEGAPGMLSFLANPKYTHYIYETKSSIVLVNNDFEPQAPIAATLVRVPDAYAAFASLLDVYQQFMKSQARTGVSSMAFVSEDAKYGENVYIGEFAYVGRRVQIGNNVQIYPQAYIGDDSVIGDETIIYPGVKLYSRTEIGKSCIIHGGAVIGADGFGFAPQEDGSYKKIPQTGNVVIEDFVEIGANTTIDRATMGSTRILKGTKIDNLVQIAHNVEIGCNTGIAAQTGVSGSTKIGANCIVAGQVGFVGHIHVADRTTVGAQSGVTNSINKPGQTWMGTPAIPGGDWKRMVIYERNLAKLSNKISELEKKLNNLTK